MIEWPSSLVREIARRRCILFLGAGVSATAFAADGTRPPLWSEFVSLVLSLVRDEQRRTQIAALVAAGRLPLALQAIGEHADPADYHNALNHCFNNPQFLPSEVHRRIMQLDSRIVVTTNFDKIFEALCVATAPTGYKVVPYDSDSLGDEIRSDTRLIIKAHGSIDNVNRMIFTKAQYHAAKKSHGNFYAMLRALLITHTCLFIGCGLEDPDVSLILEDVRVTTSSNRPHYATVLAGEHDDYIRQDWARTYNIRCLEYQPDHGALLGSLDALLVSVERIRRENPEP